MRPLKSSFLSAVVVLLSAAIIQTPLFAKTCFADATYKELLEARLLLCSGNAEKISTAKAQLNGLLKTSPNDPGVFHLLHAFLPDDSNAFNSATLSKIKSGVAPASELDRVIFAGVLFLQRETDLSSVDKLLDFHSEKRALEADRLNLVASVDITRGNPKEAFAAIESAQKTSPRISPSLLAELLVSDMDEVAKKKSSKSYLNDISKLDDRDPYKLILSGLVGRQDGTLSAGDYFSKAKQAYEICSVDSYAVNAYVHSLGSLKYSREAYEILNHFTEAHKYYFPHVDSDLLYLALRLKKWDVADAKIRLLRGSFVYKENAATRKTVEDSAEYLRKQQRKELLAYAKWTLGILLILGALILIYRQMRNVQQKRPKRDLSSINYEELNAAENRLRQENEEFVPAKIFKSKDVREDYLIELIGYLDSIGVDATYETGPTSWPFLDTYILKVRPGQLEQAKEALEKYQSVRRE